MESFSGFHIIQQAAGVLCMPAAVHVTWIKVMETLINSLIGVCDVGEASRRTIYGFVRFLKCYLFSVSL